jgi:tripartite-type tricarboxylate transporter receptor subunit TctC
MSRFARTFAAAVAATVGIACVGAPATAQSWPSKPVKVVIPFPPGGPTDVLGRPVAEHLSKVLGQPFIIDNRAGGGTTIGAQAVIKADPDGYTLFLGTNTPYALAPIFNPNAGYKYEQFQPIIMIAESPMLMAASIKSGAKTTADVIAGAKREPWSFASVGQTTTTHLLAEWFSQEANIKMAHVPYRGSAPAMNDLVGGQVQLFFDVASSAVPQVRAKTITPVMILDSRRWSQIDTVPTSKEAGYPAFLATFWAAMAAPGGTPKAIVERINKEVNTFLMDKEFVSRLDNIMYRPVGGSPEVMSKRVKEEAEVWYKVGKNAGLVK